MEDNRGSPDSATRGSGSPSAPQSGRGIPVEGYAGLVAGDFINGSGLLGLRRISPPDPTIQPAALSLSLPFRANPGPVQTATQAVNGVPLAIYQPQPSDTGATAVGDVGALRRSLSNLAPKMLERMSNANIAFISVPDSVDQAFPSSGLLSQHPQGWPQNKDWGDVPGGYFDAKANDWMPGAGPQRVVVVGPHKETSSYDVGDHEAAHAWDDLNGAHGRGASQLPEFQAGYAAEVPNLRRQAQVRTETSPGDNSGYYYLQGRVGDTDVGAREAYAESFARYMAGDPHLKTDWPSLYAYWEAQDRAQGLRATQADSGQ